MARDSRGGRAQSHREPPPPGDARARLGRRTHRRGDRRAQRPERARDLAAPEGPPRRRARLRPRGRQPAPLPRGAGAPRRAPRRARGVLGRAARAPARRPGGPRMSEEVVCEIAIRAPAAAVYAMFTDPAQLVRWIGIRALLEPRPGGAFRFELVPGGFCTGRSAEPNPTPPFGLTWGWGSGGIPAAPGRRRARAAPAGA